MECIDSRTQHFTQAFPFDCGAHAANRVRGRAVANANANASFSLVHATGSTYKQFISDLRKALTVNSQIVYGIPVLPDPTGLARFILVNLTNYNGESITVAIKVVDAYVVAYQAGNKAYFLNDVYDELRQVLFKGTESVRLPFKGNYDDLERRAGSREKIDLGFSELGSAIGNLFHYNNKDVTSAARGFIVIIQTLAEAARFKYIEQRVSENVESKFKPDPAFLSLENRWKDLSKQILLAQKHGGKFEHPVPVRSVSNKPILVKDVSSPVVKGIALLRNTSKEDGPIHLMMMEQCFEQWEDARGDFGIDF